MKFRRWTHFGLAALITTGSTAMMAVASGEDEKPKNAAATEKSAKAEKKEEEMWKVRTGELDLNLPKL